MFFQTGAQQSTCLFCLLEGPQVQPDFSACMYDTCMISRGGNIIFGTRARRRRRYGSRSLPGEINGGGVFSLPSVSNYHPPIPRPAPRTREQNEREEEGTLPSFQGRSAESISHVQTESSNLHKCSTTYVCIISIIYYNGNSCRRRTPTSVPYTGVVSIIAYL